MASKTINVSFPEQHYDTLKEQAIAAGMTPPQYLKFAALEKLNRERREKTGGQDGNSNGG